MCNYIRRNKQFHFLGLNIPKMDLGLEVEKTNVGTRISILNISVCQFSVKMGNFDFFGPNLPKNEFWSRNFKNLSPDSESAPPRYHECQFSVKMDDFELFDLNLGKLPNYVRYFGSNNVEGVAESWIETEMIWMEIDGAG